MHIRIALVLQPCGRVQVREAMKGWLIRAQTLRSERIYLVKTN